MISKVLKEKESQPVQRAVITQETALTESQDTLPALFNDM